MWAHSAIWYNLKLANTDFPGWSVMFGLDYFGRVRFIQLACILNVITAAIEGAAVDLPMLLVAQFFNGIGTGAILTTIPVFQAEIAPARQRGRITGLHGFLNVSGSVSSTFPKSFCLVISASKLIGTGYCKLDWLRSLV